MSGSKKDLIKLLTVAVTICISLFVFLLPKTQAKAEDAPTGAVFSLCKDAGIRLPDGVDEIVDGVEKRYKGLLFSTQVGDLWFEENSADEYVFGTLIFPEDKGELNVELSEYDNAVALSAAMIVPDVQDVKANGGYTASIVFDSSTVKQLAISRGLVDKNDSKIEEKVDKLLRGLYSLRLTAVSFVKMGDDITYTDSYTTSLIDVSVGLLSDSSWVEDVSEYVTLENVVQDGYVLVENGRVGNLVVSDVKNVYVDGKAVEYQVDGETLIIPSLLGADVGNEYEIVVLNHLDRAVVVNAVAMDINVKINDEDYSSGVKMHAGENVVIEVYNGQTKVNTLIASSSDIVSVDGSTVTAVNNGTCELTLTCESNGVKFSEIIYVEVAHDYEIKFDENCHWKECKDCHIIIDEGSHLMGGGNVTKQPTCDEFGVTTYACACGYKIYEDIAMVGHDLGAFNEEVPATCEQNGIKAHYQCSSCLQYFDEDEDLIEDVSIPKAHVFKKYNQPIEPLCAVTGRVGFYHCEVCGKFFKFDKVTELQESELQVPALGHSDMSTGRCPCGKNYASDEFFFEYFEFVIEGFKLPDEKDLNNQGNDNYTYGYRLNRFYGDMQGAPVHIRIPTTYNGRKVLSIGDYVFDTTSSRASKCSLGGSGHENCTVDTCEKLYYYKTQEDGTIKYPTDGNPNAVAIQSIVIPEGIMFIGSSVFGGSELTELIIPNSVVGGNSVKKDVVADGAVYNKDIYDYPLYNICSGCDLLERVVIGSGVDVVGSYCFYNLKSLKDVEFVVQEVDNGDGTTRLEGVKEIRYRAFGSANNTIDPTQSFSIPKFVIPETLVSLPEGDIYDTNISKTVRLYQLHTSNMIYYLNITEEEYNDLIIPAKERDELGNIINEADIPQTTYGYTEGWCGTSLLYFKGEWFYNDEGVPTAYEEVTEMEVPFDDYDDTFKILNNGTIVGLTDEGKALETLNIPLTINGVKITRIASSAFKYSKATSVVLSENVTCVDAYAFRKMSNLKSVVATTNLTSVGRDLFKDSINVRNIVIISKNASVSDIAITGSNKIASISEKLGDFTLSISGTSYLFTNDLTTYTLDANGFLFNSENVLCAYLGDAKEITVYDDIVEIGDSAFENLGVNIVNLPAGLKKIGNNAFKNSDLISIELPAGITEIGEGAFAYSKIKEFTLPSGVKTISASAFAGCNLLKRFNFNDVVTEIGDGAFSGCVKILNIVLPSSVTRIGNNAFVGCERLENVFIPASVESIGAYAFSNCNGIVSFEYEGARAEWNLMDINRTWNFATKEFDVIFADGVGGYLDIQDEMTLVINNSGIISHKLSGILFWSSSDDSVATVDENGKVTAIDVGQAIITVKMGRDIGKCTVNVVYGDYLPTLVVENGVQDGDYLELGKTYNLYSHVMFNRKEFFDHDLTCISSDATIASVVYDQNSRAIVLNALSTGKVRIIVSATWRDFTSDDAYTLIQTFEFDVIG